MKEYKLLIKKNKIFYYKMIPLLPALTKTILHYAKNIKIKGSFDIFKNDMIYIVSQTRFQTGYWRDIEKDDEINKLFSNIEKHKKDEPETIKNWGWDIAVLLNSICSFRFKYIESFNEICEVLANTYLFENEDQKIILYRQLPVDDALFNNVKININISCGFFFWNEIDNNRNEVLVEYVNRLSKDIMEVDESDDAEYEIDLFKEYKSKNVNNNFSYVLNRINMRDIASGKVLNRDEFVNYWSYDGIEYMRILTFFYDIEDIKATSGIWQDYTGFGDNYNLFSFICYSFIFYDYISDLDTELTDDNILDIIDKIKKDALCFRDLLQNGNDFIYWMTFINNYPKIMHNKNFTEIISYQKYIEFPFIAFYDIQKRFYENQYEEKKTIKVERIQDFFLIINDMINVLDDYIKDEETMPKIKKENLNIFLKYWNISMYMIKVNKIYLSLSYNYIEPDKYNIFSEIPENFMGYKKFNNFGINLLKSDDDKLYPFKKFVNPNYTMSYIKDEFYNFIKIDEDNISETRSVFTVSTTGTKSTTKTTSDNEYFGGPSFLAITYNQFVQNNNDFNSIYNITPYKMYDSLLISIQKHEKLYNMITLMNQIKIVQLYKNNREINSESQRDIINMIIDYDNKTKEKFVEKVIDKYDNIDIISTYNNIQKMNLKNIYDGINKELNNLINIYIETIKNQSELENSKLLNEINKNEYFGKYKKSFIESININQIKDEKVYRSNLIDKIKKIFSVQQELVNEIDEITEEYNYKNIYPNELVMLYTLDELLYWTRYIYEKKEFDEELIEFNNLIDEYVNEYKKRMSRIKTNKEKMASLRSNGYKENETFKLLKDFLNNNKPEEFKESNLSDYFYYSYKEYKDKKNDESEYYTNFVDLIQNSGSKDSEKIIEKLKSYYYYNRSKSIVNAYSGVSMIEYIRNKLQKNKKEINLFNEKINKCISDNDPSINFIYELFKECNNKQ